MSQTVDTNILVYASHTASPFHGRARAFIEHLVAGPRLTYLLWPAVTGYLRVVTHPNILGAALTIEEAMSNIDGLLAPSHMRVAGEGGDFWASFRRVAADAKPRGKLVADAHLVALMAEHGVSTMWSNDRDFRKFDGITVRNPLDAKYATGFDR